MKRLMVGIATLGLPALYGPAQGGRIHRCMGEPATVVGATHQLRGGIELR
jgi:hypothetical protein